MQDSSSLREFALTSALPQLHWRDWNVDYTEYFTPGYGTLNGNPISEMLQLSMPQELRKRWRWGQPEGFRCVSSFYMGLMFALTRTPSLNVTSCLVGNWYSCPQNPHVPVLPDQKNASRPKFKPHNIGKWGEIQHFLYSLIKNVMLWPKVFGNCFPKLTGSQKKKAVHCPANQAAMFNFLTKWRGPTTQHFTLKISCSAAFDNNKKSLFVKYRYQPMNITFDGVGEEGRNSSITPHWVYPLWCNSSYLLVPTEVIW